MGGKKWRKYKYCLLIIKEKAKSLKVSGKKNSPVVGKIFKSAIINKWKYGSKTRA